jgi:signal transduction histidine kinase
VAFNIGTSAIYRDAFRKTDEIAAIVEIAPRGRLIDATDRLLTACHLERNSALGRPLDRLFNPATAARLLDVSRAAVANAGNEEAAPDMLAAPSTRFLNGRICALPLSPNLAFLRACDAPSVRGVRRDELLNEMGALSDGLIYIYDIERERTSYMNASLERLFGLEPGRPLYLSALAPLVHAEDVDDVSQHVAGFRTLVDRQVTRHSFRLFSRSDNTWRVIENRYAALSRDPTGAVRTVIGCAFDITDRDDAAEHETTANAVLQAEDTARRRIARELHDSTAQHLVAADLMVGLHLRESGHGADDALASARSILGQALREIRTLSFLLHPPGGRAAGLPKMLRGFAQGFAERSNLLLTLQIDAPEKLLPPDIELILFRVCQEAFMNVRRHANARNIALRLYTRSDDILLDVEDDGDGIDDVSGNLGVGIESMRARLSEIGGALTIENTGNGTLVRACVPKSVSGGDPSRQSKPIATYH